MKDMNQIIDIYADNCHRLLEDAAYAASYKMPSGNYFLEDGSVMSLPREDGDSRYPYGEDGFNFWTYASGYMHCNEGLFSPFLRAAEGQEPKIAFFASFEEAQGQERDLVPLLGVPVIESKRMALRYTVFTTSATYFFCEVEGHRFVVRVFVDRDSSICFSLFAGKPEGGSGKVQLGYYLNPFVKNALVENSVDRWFRRVSYKENEDLGSFTVKAFEEQDRLGMAPNIGVFKLALSGGKLNHHQVTTSRYDFVGGSRSSLHRSLGLRKGAFEKGLKVCAFTETAIMGGILDVDLEVPLRVDGMFSYSFDEQTMREDLGKLVRPEVLDSQLEKVALREADKGGSLEIEFENDGHGMVDGKVMTPFMKQVMKQVAFCATIKGYIQLSSFSLIGIRDVFQALEGVLYYEKEIARGKMLEALNFVTKEGRCPRQYILPREKGQLHGMDLRPFIDQGVWVISAIVTYLRYTKDYDFLRVPVGYYEFVDEHKHLARQAEGEGSVLDHMLAIMSYLLANKDTGHTECIHALYGDWNDALDGLGRTDDPNREYGTGVSVMATLQVYQNLEEMLELLEILKKKGAYKDRGEIEKYNTAREDIASGLMKYAVVHQDEMTKILHGWGDRRSYLVGGFKDPDGISRDGLTAGAFWILSGMLKRSPDMKKVILETFDRLEGKYGLKTFHPHFEMGTPGVGRIPDLPAGTAENGATYIHASLFGVMALFASGESKRAWSELEKLLPFTHEHISCSPFVMPNSYGYNEDFHIDGESMADWQTGSSNVLLKLILKYVVGFNPQHEGLVIQPANHCPFAAFSCRLDYMGTKLTLRYSNHHHGDRKFVIDGKVVEGAWDTALAVKTLAIGDRNFTGGEMTIEIRD